MNHVNALLLLEIVAQGVDVFLPHCKGGKAMVDVGLSALRLEVAVPRVNRDELVENTFVGSNQRV